MKKVILLLIVCIGFRSYAYSFDLRGQQPQLSSDKKGIIRLVFGNADSIFCCTSVDHGLHFSRPLLVGTVNGMHLGMARGPQLASSNKLSIVTAMDKIGNIHTFILNNNTNKWKFSCFLNDVKGSAPEGLMNIAADNNDHFYAVWLDTRIGKTNNICFTDYLPEANKWAANKFIYISPDKHVCECCRPSIIANKNNIGVMFRNWLDGSRDLYKLVSKNAGKSFSKAVKLGNDTWKLNGCPMDGGGIVFHHNKLNTIWRRHDQLFYCFPDNKEVYIANGRNCTIVSNNNQIFFGFTRDGSVIMENLKSKQQNIIAKGDYLKLLVINGQIICAWENNNQIKTKIIEIVPKFPGI